MRCPARRVRIAIGTDRARALGAAGRFHELRRVVSNLGVFDFGGPDGTLRLVSLHPGVSRDDVVTARTGFGLAFADDVTTTRAPTAEELALIRRFDPEGRAQKELS